MEYPKTAQNSVKRHRERGSYDYETVRSIVNAAPVAHVGFVPDPADPVPVVLPMVARIGQFRDEPPCCYVHGYVSARMFRSASTSSSLPSASPGVPVCVSAALVDGLVLALTPFNHSYNYRSAVVHGHAELLDPAADAEENLWAMRLVTDGMVPGRWEGSRVPPEPSEIASTRILRVRIDSASTKTRDAGPSDDRHDLANDAVRRRVWTGVIPYRESLGAPVPSESNLVPEVPAYITDHVRRFNGEKEGGSGLVGRVMGSIFGSS